MQPIDERAPSIDEVSQQGQGGEDTLDRRAPLLGTGARLGIGGKAPLGLGEALVEQVSSLAQTGSAHLEIAPPAVEQGGAGIESGAYLALRSGGLGFRRLPRFEVGHHRFELGDTALFGGENLGEVIAANHELLLLDGDLPPLDTHPGERLRRRGEATVVELQPLGDLGGVTTGHGKGL